MNNYSELSVLEINRACAVIIFPGSEVVKADDMIIGDQPYAAQVIHKVGISGEYVDYCGNPADSWKLMVDNKIEISYPDNGSNEWCAHSSLPYSPDEKYIDAMTWSKNPGRAVAECFLMIKGGEV